MIADDWRPTRVLGTYTRRSATGVLVETYHDGYEVNESAAFIWAHVGSGMDVAEIVEAVLLRYELDSESADQTVRAFIAELLDKGFIDPGSD